MGKITAGSWTYILTENDKLWAARMCAREGGDPADVLWTMTQAFAGFRIRRPTSRSTFTEFIQGYSQPINPKWRRDGLFCRPGGSHAMDTNCDRDAGPVGACCETLLARRDSAATMPFSAASPEVKSAVTSWFAGTLPNPVPKAVEFADQRVGNNFVANHAGSTIVKNAGNAYIATAASLRWPPNFVTMTGGGGSTTLPILLVVALGLSAGVGFALYRRRRRMRGFGTLKNPGQSRYSGQTIQREAEDAVYDLSNAYHDAMWPTFSRSGWSDEDHPREIRKGEAEPMTTNWGGSSHKGWIIKEEFDCADLNKSIVRMQNAKFKFELFVMAYDPSEFENIVISNHPDEEPPHFDADFVEDQEAFADEAIEKLRSIARANGCEPASIKGMRLR